MSANDPHDPQDPSDAYALGRSEAETARLIRQGQIYGPFTRQFFAASGITAGMKVLDVGSGAGDVALLVADMVGPRGAVVGIDTNTVILETARARVRAAGWTNVSFLAGDVRDIGLDTDFDAVVGRWVLMYSSDPAALLRRLVNCLRPGGIVAFQENDFTNGPMLFPQTPLFERVGQWGIPRLDHRPPGAPDPQMGLKLYRTYLDAGLPAPQLRLDAPLGGGPDWPGYAYVADTLRSLLPFLQRMGVQPPAELADPAEDVSDWTELDTLADRLRDEAVSQRAVQVLATVIGAWARRP